MSEISVTQEEITEEADDVSDILIGSGEYLIVGIRYYKGVAHPNEYVELIREPNNPYDRNAIRVDNMQGEKVGHIKATMASTLATILDNSDRLRVRVDGTIPRSGNAYTVPIFLEFYCTASNVNNREEIEQIALNFQNIMKRDYHFHIAREFGGDGVSSNEVVSVSSAPIVSRTKLNWQQQEEALNKMFDKQLEDQYKDLPDVSMPSCLKGITLFDYQIKGVKWLFKKETNPSPAPFYKQVTEKGKKLWFCEITNSSQSDAPDEIRGSILCDEMGLGKSIQTICLILLGPPAGVEYKVKKLVPGEAKQIIPTPEDNVIRAANTSILKTILKNARLAVSGKKQDLVDRIIKAKANDEIAGEYFPESMRPVVGDVSRCTTLIVCPVSVMSNWTEQIENYVEEGVLSLRMFHGPNRNDLLPEIKNGNVDVLLVSYQTLAAEYSNIFAKDGKDAEEPQKKRSRRESIFDIDFHRIVLDEAVSNFQYCILTTSIFVDTFKNDSAKISSFEFTAHNQEWKGKVFQRSKRNQS